MSFAKTLILFICLLLPATGAAYDLQFENKDYGKLNGQIKGIYILSGEDNGYDPNDGAAYLFKLKYLTPDYKGFKTAAGLYVNGDLFGLTDWDTEKVARGLLVDDDGDHTAQLGEIYARYETESFYAFGGRMLMDTPLTKNTYSTIPNFYTAIGVGGKPFKKLDLGLTHIAEMSFGARAMTDFGLIGEGTGTAGATIKPSSIGQAEFHSISEVALGGSAPSTNGITSLSMTYSGLEKTKVRLWDYYAHDINNSIYMDAETKIDYKKLQLTFSVQYLHQGDVGDSLAGEVDFNLFGLKSGIGGKKWTINGLFNTSFGDTDMLNPWGGDPAFTSTIFSRNAYRRDVNAWGVGGDYTIMKGLKFMAAYVDYGRSGSIGRVGGVGQNLAAQDDACEMDLTLVWKPSQIKGLTLKTFYVHRISEYNGSNGRELEQNHWRIIMVYTF